MHTESFNSFVVFDYRVESFLFKFLPISAELILIMRVEQKEEIFDV